MNPAQAVAQAAAYEVSEVMEATKAAAALMAALAKPAALMAAVRKPGLPARDSHTQRRPPQIAPWQASKSAVSFLATNVSV